MIESPQSIGRRPRRHKSRRSVSFLSDLVNVFVFLVGAQVVVLIVFIAISSTVETSQSSHRAHHWQKLRQWFHQLASSGDHYLLVTQGQPLDHYYSRHHVPYNDNSTSNNKNITMPRSRPILVIGGSDGSGTRGFVQAVMRLGVPMLLDEGGTLDDNGMLLFDYEGWPPLVQWVLNHTHSANYQLEDLPETVQELVLHEMSKLVTQYERRGAYLWEERAEGQVQVRNVKYGFKAPVSMLLLPLLKKVFGKIKFLHVVRDGRDVALSGNQSPVKKFYHSYYPRATKTSEAMYNTTDMNIRAMELWNDWNRQVLEWCQANHSDDDDSFDYLTMRFEDLVNPVTKYESLAQLAHFVGSEKSLDTLCCMSPTAPPSSIIDHDSGHSLRRPGPGVHIPPHRRKLVGMEKLAKYSRQRNATMHRSRPTDRVEEKDGFYSKTSMPLVATRRPRFFDRVERKDGSSISFKRFNRNVPVHFGKWIHLLEDKADLSRQLHLLGKESLANFGYQPPARFLDVAPTNWHNGETWKSCSFERLNCSQIEPL